MKKICLFILTLKMSVCLAQSSKKSQTDTSTTFLSEKYQPTTSADMSNYFVNNNNSNSTNESYLRAFNYQEGTKGSRYLFDKWVKGSVTNLYGQRIASDLYLFNYDKIAGSFLLTPDSKTVIELNKDQIGSCQFTEGMTTYKFARVEGLGKNVFCVVLVDSGTPLKLYKKITTKFEKANFTTNGIATSGHNYDLYIDKPVYYLYSPTTNQVKQIDLKKKSIKEAMPQDQAKVDAYFSQHSDMPVNEDFVIGLVISLK